MSRLMPGLMSSFSGNRPTYGSGHRSTHRSGHWDESTIGAPGDDPEVVGAGDPERVLALVPGKSLRKSMQSEKNQITKTTSVTEISDYQHQHSESESSSSPRH